MPDVIAPAQQIESPRIAPSASEPCRVEPVSAWREADWDGYVLDHPDGQLFHTMAWRNAVRDAFGHEAVYLVATRIDRIVGVLPLFIVKSRIGGRMMVSVPYAVGGGILAEDDQAAESLFDAAKSVASRRRCRVIDLRSERAAVPALPTVDRYVGFRRELPDDPNDVLAWLPRKARAAARNARDKYRLDATYGDEQLREVWRLYTISMRRLGSLAYPFRFFSALVAHTPDGHWVSVVRRDGRPVAGLVTFLFQNTVIPYFIGSTDEAKRCSAANFIYFSAMQRGVAQGFREFDFGRSRRDNTGSFNFKRFHGFTPRPLEYQTYVAPGAEAVNMTPSNPKFRLARAVWRRLPLAVTRSIGGCLARHVPG